MENVKNASGFICIVRVVSVVHIITSFSLFGFFFKELIFGFLQISDFATSGEWLLMFVTVSFSLIWNMFLGIFIEARSWRFSSVAKPVEEVIHSVLFKIWELNLIIFLLVDLIGNLTLFLYGQYEWYLVLTWILPLLLFLFVVIAFWAETQKKEERETTVKCISNAI